VISLQLCIIK